MFAPNADQMHVVNHSEGKPTAEKRNILQESARIARGDISDLVKIDVSAFDALIIPGEAGRISFLISFIFFFFFMFQGALVQRKTFVIGQWRIRTTPSNLMWRRSSRLSTKPESLWECAASPLSSLPKSCLGVSSPWDMTKSATSTWIPLLPLLLHTEFLMGSSEW